MLEVIILLKARLFDKSVLFIYLFSNHIQSHNLLRHNDLPLLCFRSVKCTKHRSLLKRFFKIAHNVISRYDAFFVLFLRQFKSIYVCVLKRTTLSNPGWFKTIIHH